MSTLTPPFIEYSPHFSLWCAVKEHTTLHWINFIRNSEDCFPTSFDDEAEFQTWSLLLYPAVVVLWGPNPSRMEHGTVEEHGIVGWYRLIIMFPDVPHISPQFNGQFGGTLYQPSSSFLLFANRHRSPRTNRFVPIAIAMSTRHWTSITDPLCFVGCHQCCSSVWMLSSG